MKRHVTAVAALLVTWTCFYLVVDEWLHSENERCQRFGDLAAECLAPQAMAAFNIGAVFGVATLLLTWLAVRSPAKLG